MSTGVARVAVAQGNDRTPAQLLEEALERSGFWEVLDRAAPPGKPGELAIAIQPDLASLDAAPHTRTDPALVEHLVDLLGERGYGNVAVVGASGRRDLWLENREVARIAERLGYRGRTAHEHAYRILDLGEDVVEAGVPPGSALEGVKLGRAWLEASFRIVFAKNRTHEAHGYALCLETLLGVVPFAERARLPVESAPAMACELLERARPQFSLIDAVVSSHGAGGSLAGRPLPTHTVIAGSELLLVDWAGAARMKLDPYVSPLDGEALSRFGLPPRYELDGELSPYPGWSNVPPLLADAARHLARSPGLQRLFESAAMAVDPALFPFKGQGAARLNRAVAPAVMWQGDAAPALWALVALGECLGVARTAVDAWRTLYAKEQVERVRAPLTLDLDALEPADFEAVVDYIEPLERLAAQTPAEPTGIRWRYLEGGVLFRGARTLAIPFRDFVARVDIAKSVQGMRDYVGGSWAPVRRDAEGRVTHQAERTLYLPQPNLAALHGGKSLDVSKLDFVRYGPDEHKVYWRSVGSENGTVEHDDGSVAFRDAGDGQTEVILVARQKFVLPPLWEAMNLDLYPWYKDRVVAYEYHGYFRETLSNYEAQYEGRPFGIGRPPREAGDDPDLLEAVRSMVEVGRKALSNLAPSLGAAPKAPEAPSPSGEPRATTLLARGLARAAGISGNALRTFLSELGQAVAEDLGSRPRE